MTDPADDTTDGSPNLVVRWLCIAIVSIGGLACLGFAVVLESEAGEEAVGGVIGAACLAMAGGLMLALAGWGVWTRHSVEGAD
ncbi:MAG TPA: hypothetical protein VH092_30995 [Urbifossiella sp.]|jgi:hypothetical protein|nr:hypothetical protein [Urbifossiella sp.]